MLHPSTNTSANPSDILQSPNSSGRTFMDQGPQAKELVGLICSRRQHAERARARYTRIWELVLNFIRGEQNLYQSEDGQLVRLVERNQKRLLSTNNQMKLAERQLLAKLTKHVPEFGVDVATGDQDQIQGALVGTEFINFIRHKEMFELKYVEMMKDVVDYGIGFLKCEWDPEASLRS